MKQNNSEDPLRTSEALQSHRFAFSQNEADLKLL